CGASLAENWATVGFFPIFLAAIISVRGRNFFNLVFIRRMLLCGLAGTLLYLLLPIIATMSPDSPLTFWVTLKSNLTPLYRIPLQFLFFALHPRDNAELLSLGLA